jgi:enoyl-CoA hydratase/carnithine racemase
MDGITMQPHLAGHAGVCEIILDRPEALNAIDTAMATRLAQACAELASESDSRVVVLSAAGDRAFCVGADLKERNRLSDAGLLAQREVFRAAFAGVLALPQPVIAAVHGVATAAGCQLVASCDLAVASEAASFATPGVDIGLFCSTPMVALSRNVPRKQAMEMLLTGEPVPAREARAIGLVNRVVPAGNEREAAIALAQKVALKSAYTVKLGKEAFYRQAEMSLADAYRYAAEVMTENMMARDAEEGIGAFIEKREPKWQDK